MAFKPNRDKLNAKFEGYKLAKEPLSCVIQTFESGVRVARLDAQDYSYQHVRTFTLHNHLVADPWDGHSVYWCDREGNIQRASYDGPAELKISLVYKSATKLKSADNSVNPTIVFLTEHLCLFANGCGSLQLLNTVNLVTPSEGRGGEWQQLEEIQLPGMEEKSFAILAARFREAGQQQLDVVTLVLGDVIALPTKEKSSTKPPIATYHWHCVTFNVTPAAAADAHTVATTTKIDGTAPQPPHGVASVRLCCSLQSKTVALYSAFVSSHLLVISEADLIPPQQLPTVEEEEKEDEENEKEGGHEERAVESKMEVDEKEEAEEEEGEGKSRKHKGLGFEIGKSSTPEYKWSQTDSDVTVIVMLPSDVTKQDIDCMLERREIVIGLTDGTTYLRDRLFAPIDPETSTWTIENHVLEVSLEKQRPGLEWPTLTEQLEQGQLLRGPVTEQLSEEELKELERKLAGSAKSEDGTPAAKRHHPLMQTTYEECDQLLEEEDATLYIISESGHISAKTPLGGRQFLFTAPPSPQVPPFFSLKHDVDAVLWQPEVGHTASGPTPTWKHVGTFNALAYIQSAKRDKKFTAVPLNFSFATICDCDHHVFVYCQPEEGVKGNAAAQYVTTLPSIQDILGLQATDSGLVFVLRDRELLVIVVSSDKN